jgi:TorA maturation chaperone TorD
MKSEAVMKADFNEDLRAVCRNAASVRSRLYRLFSVAFHFPSEEVVRVLNGPDSLKVMDEISDVYFVTQEFGSILNAIRETTASLVMLPDLQAEYTRLFIGPFHVPASPYESVYSAGAEGRVMGEAALRVREMYLSEGLDLSDSIRDLPDHLIAEMEFMAYLAEEEAAAWGENAGRTVFYLVKQEAFLDEHLQQWIPKFSAAVCANARNEFYRHIAKVTERIVSLDRDYVKAVRISVERGEV